jgi:16S rRNA (guanine527-N7)-methyltransferase
VLRGRAEEQATDWAALTLAKALAPPPVAAEWCLPLVKRGGAAILWVGEGADLEALARAASRLAAEPEDAPAGLAVLRKTGSTPAGFPRRTGVARKRPLA